MTGIGIQMMRPHTDVPYTVAALVEPAGCAGDLSDDLRSLLRAEGWRIEAVPHQRVSSSERENWDVIVISTKRITEDTLLLVARASRFPATRVALVSPDRDPHHIADTLRSGVDDYVVAPFQPQECLVRLTALAHHGRSIRARHVAGPQQAITLNPSNLNLDPTTRSVRDGSARVALSIREWDVLAALLHARERLLSAEDLAESVWGSAGDAARAVSTISRLRRKLRAAGVRTLDVVTVRGLGYTARLG